MDVGGLPQEHGKNCRAGAVAEEDNFSRGEGGEGVGVGAEFLGEIAGGAVARRAFAVADAGFFDAEGGVARAGEGVEERGLGRVLLGVAAGAGEPEDGGFGLFVGWAGEEGAAAVVLGWEFAVFDGDAGGLFGGRGEVVEREGEGLTVAEEGEGDLRAVGLAEEGAGVRVDDGIAGEEAGAGGVGTGLDLGDGSEGDGEAGGGLAGEEGEGKKQKRHIG